MIPISSSQQPTMFSSQRHTVRGPLLYLKAAITTTFSCYPSSLFPLRSLYTVTPPFPALYLATNLSFSPYSALKASKYLRFKTPHNPDSVLAFFREWGFSDSQLHTIIKRAPWLLSCRLHKTVLPKFQFLMTRGASASDIVSIVTKNPALLSSSLEKNIIPSFDLIHRRLLQSNKATINSLGTNAFNYNRVRPNVDLLIECGVSVSNINSLLRRRPNVLVSPGFMEVVEEVKGLGFCPSKSAFSLALHAKCCMSKSKWDKKVRIFKNWGWSDEDFLEAFRRQPNCMLASCDKINAAMRFWVNQLGWDARALVKGTNLFGFSLEKRIVPRAFVVQYLLARGLMDKGASILSPFCLPEDMFFRRYVMRFGEDEKFQLIKLYREKKKKSLRDNRASGCIASSS